MNDQLNLKDFSEALTKMLLDKNVASIEVNGKILVKKSDSSNAIIAFCEESLAEGNQSKGILNMQNMMKFKKANEVLLTLLDEPNMINLVCRDNLSYASTTVECKYFGFDIENVMRKNKAQYDEFSSLISSMEINAGVAEGHIRINFTVNDVWS